MIEVKVQPQDVDGVHSGQRVTLRFPAFNMRTTPEINGLLTRVSADVSVDSKSGASFYTARAEIAPGQDDRLGGLRLIPGMPVEAHVLTGDRTVLSYLPKPLADQIAKTWRER